MAGITKSPQLRLSPETANVQAASPFSGAPGRETAALTAVRTTTQTTASINRGRYRLNMPPAYPAGSRSMLEVARSGVRRFRADCDSSHGGKQRISASLKERRPPSKKAPPDQRSFHFMAYVVTDA